MKKWTFRNQVFLGLVILLLSFICATVFKLGIFSNIGWILDGLLFLLHPVYPGKAEASKGELLAVRLAGIFMIFVGLVTRFGV